jgi:hypothetical protein
LDVPYEKVRIDMQGLSQVESPRRLIDPPTKWNGEWSFEAVTLEWM